jgi:RNA polymerase sigma-70 factor (ECF subfamily)
MSRPPKSTGTGSPWPDDDKFVEAVCRNEAGAFEAFIHRFQVCVSVTAYRFSGGSSEEARDIVQEIYLHLWKQLCSEKGWKRTAGSLGAWVATVARNKAIDEARKRGRNPPVIPLEELVRQPIDHSGSPQDKTALKELVARVQHEMENMPPNYRIALVLWRWQYTHEEIAEILQVTTNQVRSWIARGKRWLRERLRPEDGGSAR